MKEVTGHLLNWLLWTSAHVVLLVGLVLIVDRVSRRFVSPGWRHALWLLALVPLVCPVLPATSWSPLNLLRFARAAQPMETAEAVTVGMDTAPGGGTLHSPARAARPQMQEPVSGEGAGTFWGRFLVALWVVGGFALTARHLRVARRFGRRLRSGTRISNASPLGELHECRRSLGVRREVAMLETHAVGSPALVGILRPTILLPVGLLAQLSRDERHCLLLHELVHVKRWDLVLDALVGLCQVVHWFNPLVHVAANRVRTTRELACDAQVLAAGHVENWGRLYSRTLLRVAAAGTAPKAVPVLAGMAERTSSIETRLRSIQRFRAPGRRGHVWGACAFALVVVAGLSRAGGTASPADKGTPRPPSTEPAVGSTENAKGPVVTFLCQSVDISGDTLEAVQKRAAELIEPTGDKRLFEGTVSGLASAADLKGILQRVAETGLKMKSFPEVRVLDNHGVTVRRGSTILYPTDLTRLDEGGRPNPGKDADGRPAVATLSTKELNLGYTMALTPHVKVGGKAVLLEMDVEILDLNRWEPTEVKDARDPRQTVATEIPLVSELSFQAQTLLPIGYAHYFNALRPTSKQAGDPPARMTLFFLTPTAVEPAKTDAEPGSKGEPPNGD
jgi:beta-lactamase regulating signal transducer with metallopeptidase domain